jgi:hypothetical protein
VRGGLTSGKGLAAMAMNRPDGDIVVGWDPGGHHAHETAFRLSWAIGHMGAITNVGQYATEPLGVVESQGTPIAAMPSLFRAQLHDRLGGTTPRAQGGVNVR